jgi:hydrogenase assembly chaperone HypC/HupF
MAIPSKVVAINGMFATVECFGQTRDVNLILLTDEVKLGDYLLVQAGNLAHEIVEEGRALEALAMMEEVLKNPMPMYEL